MIFIRLSVCLVLSLILLAGPGCSPTDSRSRIEAALATLESDASGARKAEACAEIRTTLAEFPAEGVDRSQLTARAIPLVVRALGDPASRVAAHETLVSIGVASYESLFDAVLEADPATQEAAVVCLIRMSNTAVPVLIPSLLSDDLTTQDRASRILSRMGRPISPTLRIYYAKILEPFANHGGSAATAEPTGLSTRGKAGVLAFAHVLGNIGDESSVLALIEGCETLRRAYPEVAAAHIRIIEGLGPDALNRLSQAQRRDYDRLKFMVEM